MLPWNLVRTVNPNGGVVYGRAVEKQFSNEQLLERILSTKNICQRTVGENTLPDYAPVTLMKRPVRTRTQGVVGRAGEKPALTRLDNIYSLLISS